MTEHSTGNRKDLGSIPSGVEAFLFSQKISSKIILYSLQIKIKQSILFRVCSGSQKTFLGVQKSPLNKRDAWIFPKSYISWNFYSSDSSHNLIFIVPNYYFLPEFHVIELSCYVKNHLTWSTSGRKIMSGVLICLINIFNLHNYKLWFAGSDFGAVILRPDVF